jgi:hypothetical protein
VLAVTPAATAQSAASTPVSFGLQVGQQPAPEASSQPPSPADSQPSPESPAPPPSAEGPAPQPPASEPTPEGPAPQSAPTEPTLPLAAAALASPQPASFLIEKIVVSGVRHGSEGIVASETLLRAGGTYTEPQLRDALQRVERLPFVVMADFSLRRGSERGRFELLVKVVETKPLFFGGTLGPEVRSFQRDGSVSWGVLARPDLGWHSFFGQSSELSLTAGGIGTLTDGYSFADMGVIEIAYRHHNLFGRHIVGSLFAGIEDFGGLYVGAEMGVPLTATSVITLSLRRWTSDSDDLGHGEWLYEVSGQSQYLSLSFRRDTTDDPFAPRRGGRLELSGGFGTGSSDAISNQDPWNPSWNTEAPPERWTESRDDRVGGGEISARHYWPLTSRLAIGLNARLTGGLSRLEGDVTRAGVWARHTVDEYRGVATTFGLELRGSVAPKHCRTGQCWWFLSSAFEAGGGRTTWDPPRRWFSPEPDRTAFEYRTSGLNTVLGIGARGRWGSFRLELSYAHYFRFREEVQ